MNIFKKLRKRWATVLAITFIVIVAGYRLFLMFMAKFYFIFMPHFATPVETATVLSQKWQPRIHTTGSLQAMQGITVKAETSGRVTALFFESGKSVTVGTPLVQIYSDTLKAELAANQAKLALSKLEYNREFELLRKNVGTQALVDKARAQMQADEAAVQKTQASIDQTLIKAPFPGKLGLRLVELGDFVSPGENIVHLENTDPMRVDFSVPEIYLNLLQDGQSVLVHSRSYPHETFSGQIYAFDSLIQPATRSLAVRAKIPNADHKLLPGTFVEVDLLVGNKQDILVVPQTAIVYDDEGNYVYRVIHQKAVKTPVTTGDIQDNQITVPSGLKPNETVVTAGQLKISEGSDVQSINQKNVNQSK